MGIIGDFFKELILDSTISDQQNQGYEPPKRYSPLESVIHEQELSGEIWHGVPLSELSRLAQTTYRGKYVRVDKNNFLVFYYSSKSGKTKESVQCDLNENGKVMRLLYNYYPGQWRDSADEFVEKANNLFSFKE